jgi:transposase-like protein
MQYEKAKELKESWGNKPCTHPNFDKEYYLSSQTGDYVCTQCGSTFTKEQMDEISYGNKKE